ncbi:MAG: AAA family ATPase, partial [Pseudomonadales bacterium]
VGVHTGSVVTGEVGSSHKTEELAVGSAPNIAARVQSLARSGTVYFTQTSHDIAGNYFDVEILGPHKLKGVEEPVNIYRAVAVNRAEYDELSHDVPFVGRSQELQRLTAAFESNVEGNGQVVLLSGEPGIGKSRLLSEMRLRTEDRAQVWVTCRCSAYHQNTTFYSITDLLRRSLLGSSESMVAADFQRLQDGLHAVGIDSSDTHALLADLLSIPGEHYSPLDLTPENRRNRTLKALHDAMLKLGSNGPAVVVIEDLHWVDPSTLELITSLVDVIDTSNLLLIMSCRPEFQPAWQPRPWQTQIQLVRLSDEEASDMIGDWDLSRRLDPLIRQELLKRADGVPLFLEELTRTVAVATTATSSPASDMIPMSLRDSMMARLDSVGDAKEVAQLGALLGRRFSFEILEAAYWRDRRSLIDKLQRLTDAALIYRTGEPPHATFTFKHALL